MYVCTYGRRQVGENGFRITRENHRNRFFEQYSGYTSCCKANIRAQYQAVWDARMLRLGTDTAPTPRRSVVSNTWGNPTRRKRSNKQLRRHQKRTADVRPRSLFLSVWRVRRHRRRMLERNQCWNRLEILNYCHPPVSGSKNQKISHKIRGTKCLFLSKCH